MVGQSFYEQEFIIVEELGRTLISEKPVDKTKHIPKVLILLSLNYSIKGPMKLCPRKALGPSLLLVLGGQLKQEVVSEWAGHPHNLTNPGPSF